MADQELTVQISAQDNGAAAVLEGQDALLNQMAASLAALNTTGTLTLAALTEGHMAAAGAATEHAAAETIFGESIGRVEGATNTAARAFSALGLESGAAAERVSAFGEALDGLGKAAPELLAVGAAVLAVAAAFEFVQHGIEDAAEEQVKFAALGQAVKDQGGNWDVVKEGVDRFLNAIEGATTYSRGEALTALNDLVTAGFSYADAEKTVAIATDVAAGTHRSLIDVVDRLKEAEAGRGMGLVQLDGKLKDLVHTHGDLSQALAQLSSDFSGQAAAALDTYQGKTEQLKNEIGHFAEEIGEHLLPYLEEGTEILIGLAESAEQHEPQIASFFDTLITEATHAISVLADLGNTAKTAFDLASGKALADTVMGNYDQVSAEVSSAGDSLNRLMDEGARGLANATAPSGYTGNQPTFQGDAGGDFMRQASQIVTDAQNRAAEVRASAAKDLGAFRAQNLQHDVQLGEPGKGSTGGGPTPVSPITDDDVDKTQDYSVALKAVDSYVKTLTDSERDLADQVKLKTDETDKDNAEMAAAAKISADARQEVTLYTGLIANETDELKTANAAHASAKTAMDNSRDAYNKYGEALGEGTKRTETERASLEQLKNEHDQAKKKFEESQQSIDELTAALEKNHSALDAASEKTHALAEAIAQLVLAYNTGTEASQQKISQELDTYGKSLEAQKAYWATQIGIDKASYADGTYSYKQYLQNKLSDETAYREASLKIEEDQTEEAKKRADYNRQEADEAATYAMSIKQQIAYYQQRYALLEQGDSNDRAEAEKYYEEIVKLEDDAYKQRADAEKKFVTDAQDQETSFLDDLISKHESLRQSLHDIFNDISSDFVKMVERMIVEAPLLTSMEKSLFNILNPGGGGSAGGSNFFGGGSSGTGGGGGADTSATSLYGAFGGLFGSAGAPSAISNLDTSSVTSTLIGSGPAQQVSDASIDSFFGYTSSNQSVDSFVKANPGGVVGGAGGSSVFSEAIQGAGIGSTAATLEGGNATGGAIGGALGGVAGPLLALALHANPLIGAGVDLLTSVLGGSLGGLIGGPVANAQNNPDQFESQTGYGQDIANLRGGQAGANGQSYFPTAQVEQFIESMGVGAGSINGAAGEGQQMRGSTGAIGSSGGVDAAEIWLSQNQGDSAQQLETMGISPAQFQSWMSQIGASSTGSGQFTQYDKNIGDVEVTGATTGGGAHTTYSQLESDLQSIMTASGSSGTGTPVFSMTEAYPGAPSVVSSNPLGSYNSTTGAYTPAAGASGVSYVPPGSASATAAGGATPAVSVVVQGNIVGPGGVDGLINIIAQGLQKQQTGQIPGAPSNLRATRYGLK